MDLRIANWIYDTFGSSKAMLTIANVLTHIGDAVTIIALIAILLIFKKTRKIGLYSMVAVLIAFSINNYVLKNIIERERPFVQNPELINALELISYKVPSGHSMPSGHANASMCLAVSVFMFDKKLGAFGISLSVICGITRMILCVHFLTDVLVGFAFGASVAIGIHYLMNFIIKKINERKVTKNENNSSSNR